MNPRPRALITGASSGLGRGYARTLAAEGYDLVLVARDADRLNQLAEQVRTTQSTHAEAAVADLSTRDGIDAVNEIIATQPIDVLINNLGIRRYEPVADAPWDAWHDILRVNILSYVSMTRAALPLLRKSGRGSIVNASSTGAVFGRKGMPAYDASKAALLALTRATAHEEIEHGIRVNAICPGYTRTTFHLKRLGEAAVDEIVPPCVMKRWADPSEMAYPLLWLASDEASYMTSATMMIDGGYIGP